MKKEKSIGLLNKGVADELEAVHQYLYFHFHLSDQGLGPLAALFKVVAIQEMGHIERLAERILFLKGEVEMTPAGPVAKITDPEAMLDKAAAMEVDGAKTYNQSAIACAENADAGSRQIFEQRVAGEENHFDRFERQRDHIRRFGLSYLALQSFDSKAAEAGPAA